MSIEKRRSRADRAVDVRQRVVAAARVRFVRDGYQVTSLDAIAADAGLTKGAVYSRFDSKADLFLALLAERIDVRSAAVAALPATGDAIEALFASWLTEARADRGWQLLILEFRIVAARDPAINRRYAALHDRTIEVVAALVERAAAAAGRQLVHSAVETARLGLGMTNGLFLEHLAAPAALPPPLARKANAAMFEALTRPARTRRGRS